MTTLDAQRLVDGGKDAICSVRRPGDVGVGEGELVHVERSRGEPGARLGDPEVADAFMRDPLCFGTLQPASMKTFYSAAPKLANPRRLRSIRRALS